MTQKLAEVFDITPSVETERQHREIVIPIAPSMEDVIKFALHSFKDIVDDTALGEPKFTARNMEVAGVFLKIAQDAITQKKQSEQKDREIAMKERALSAKSDSDEPPEDDREMLIENLKAKRKTVT